jgi:peroxiredoxin
MNFRRIFLGPLTTGLATISWDYKFRNLNSNQLTVIRFISLRFPKSRTCFLFFRERGSPLEPNSNQDLWDQTPGARGCTPQSCGFRDLYSEFTDLGFAVFGLSMQNSAVQKEIAQRNELPFPLLSDSEYLLTNALNLPTFMFEGERLIKRMALIVQDGRIQKVFYPVFPPDQNASEVLAWIKENKPTRP